MKKIFVFISISVFLIVGLGTASAFAEGKIGVVNVQRLLAESDASKAMEQKFKAAREKMENDLQAKAKAIETLSQQLESSSVLSPEARADKEREGRQKVDDFRALEQTYAQDLQSMEVRYLERMQKEILEVVDQVAVKGNYTVILDAQTALYYQKVIDVTVEVLKGLNSRNIKFN
mgnify:CR=1 FL=1